MTRVRILRIVSAYLFLQHGTAKLLHVPHVAIFDQVQLLALTGIRADRDRSAEFC